MHSDLYYHQLRLSFTSSFSSAFYHFINSTIGLLSFEADLLGNLLVKGIGKWIGFLVNSNSIYDINMLVVSLRWLGLIMVENRMNQASNLRSAELLALSLISSLKSCIATILLTYI